MGIITVIAVTVLLQLPPAFEPAPATERGRLELTLYPVVPQLTRSAIQPMGSATRLGYRASERVSLFVQPQVSWNVRVAGAPSSSPGDGLVLDWMALGGAELLLFNLPVGRTARWTPVASLAFGWAGSRQLLRPGGGAGVFGDAGQRPVFSGSVGARLSLGKHVVLRAELGDLFFLSTVDRVNGCTGPDLVSIERTLRSGEPSAEAPVSEGCQAWTFNQGDTGEARRATTNPAAQLIHRVGAYLGASALF
jgi:hypothetical protein